MSNLVTSAMIPSPNEENGFHRFESHRPFLMKMALKRLGCTSIGSKDASDFVQETILAAVTEERRGRGPEPTDPDRRRWLWRVLRNQINAALRHEAILTVDSQPGEDPSDPGTPPPGKAIKGENALRLASAMERLSPEDRQLVEWDMNDVSRREVAERLGVSASYASQITKRAMQRLREAYSACCAGSAT